MAKLAGQDTVEMHLTSFPLVTVHRHRFHAHSLSFFFLLVIERLERARCATARETGVSKVDSRAENGKEGRGNRYFFVLLPILRAAVPLARSRRPITVDEKEKDYMQSIIAMAMYLSEIREQN